LQELPRAHPGTLSPSRAQLPLSKNRIQERIQAITGLCRSVCDPAVLQGEAPTVDDTIRQKGFCARMAEVKTQQRGYSPLVETVRTADGPRQRTLFENRIATS